MADLIDRQKIKARFEPWLKVQGYSEGELNMLRAVLYEITVMPPAQPERKNGKWVNINDGKWNTVEVLKCSVCGDMDNRMYRTDKFCPNCGARMDGEHDG